MDTDITTYTTRTEAIQREIIEPITNGDATENDFNIDAIADLIIGEGIDKTSHQFFYVKPEITVDEFWKIVETHAR